MITGGSSVDFDTEGQKRDHYRSVNHVALTGPVVQTKWSHVPITFDAREVDLRSTPHADAMVISCRVAGWDLHKVLVDNGSQADIIFLHAFDRMRISHSLLKLVDNPLYGFGGKGTFPISKIELPLSFGVAPNARSDQVIFNIVDMVYSYNAIMGRGSLNKFEAAIHGLYLWMKIPGLQGVITVYGDQQTARNIKRDFVLGQQNIHCLTAEREGFESNRPVEDKKSQSAAPKQRQDEGGTPRPSNAKANGNNKRSPDIARRGKTPFLSLQKQGCLCLVRPRSGWGQSLHHRAQPGHRPLGAPKRL
jgi:hypothetical protein